MPAVNLNRLSKEELLSSFKRELPSWMDIASFRTGYHPFFTTIFLKNNYAAEDTASLRYQAALHALTAAAHCMAQNRLMSGMVQECVAWAVPHVPEALTLLADPTLAYAYLDCLFTAHARGMSDIERQTVQTLLNVWLPSVNDTPLPRETDSNALANRLFDTAWLALYGPDFNAMDYRERNALFLAHPPLHGFIAPAPVPVVLPHDVSVLS